MSPQIVESPFVSQGMNCAGRLYLPADLSRKPPVVVMAHGFGTEKEFRLPAFAERFVRELDCAVFLFDYRNFGGSAGTPRNLVNPWRHVQDLRAALSHIRELPEVDGSRIALWGSSFGGGHVLVAAARDPEVRAVVSQVPFVDGLASLSMLTPLNMLKATGHGLLDGLKGLLGLKPHTVPIVSTPERFGAMNSPESFPGYMAIVPEGSTWRNAVPARIALIVSFYSPMRAARKVRCPVLLVAARGDSLVPVQAVRKTARRISDCEFEELDCNHFAPYFGEWFEKNIELQTEFLQQHLFS